MDTASSFACTGKFYAQKQFPYGIARSGEFNKDQAQLLETHGKAYEALHNGTRVPVNSEEKQFIEMCSGSREPSTDHEKAWSLFCEKTRKKPAVHSLGLSETDSSAGYEPIDDDW